MVECANRDEEYLSFVKKFEAKKTTDDCYTPPLVYAAVANYVSQKYGVQKDDFVRPFIPNGNYQAEEYKKSDIVVDNPPFSLMSEIIKFYNDNGVKYFLFAPHLTIFSNGNKSSYSSIICGNSITYDNGANIITSFITNLEDCAFRSSPTLYKELKKANELNLKKQKKKAPKYDYPLDLITSSMLISYSRCGIDYCVGKDECALIRALDSQKEVGKAVFGSGYLISSKKKAEREKAEREKAERWQLSEREINIINRLK